jgi:3-oxoadipate enol-lactonase/4-carboxymuconolactone decarboxylase
MPMIRVGDADLFYELAGPTDGPVVVLSNSLGTTLSMWDDVVGAVTDRFRVLRYDTRGHGRSTVVDRPASVHDLAGDLAGLLDRLGIERAHIAGLSLGGMIAQAFAIRFPDRVRSLVLMATSAYMPSTWDERIEAVRAGGMAAIADGLLARWFTPRLAHEAPGKVEAMRQQLLGTDAAGYAVCCGVIRDMDLRADLAAITAPTLVIAGADDPATPPAHAEALRAGIADAELVLLPRAAHLLAVERPEPVSAYLRTFLDRHTVPSDRRIGGASFEAGLENRKAVLGTEHVERSLAKAGRFGMPWQDFITRTAWGEVWGDPTLPRKTRSLVTLAMMIALNREEEFKLHLRPAIGNGVSLAELQALLLHSAIYAGVPATNGAFRWTREVFGDELD